MRWMLPALLVISMPVAAGAAVPCRLCSDGSTIIPAEGATARVALDVQTSLDFDRVILTGPAGGTAILAPDGRRTTSGSITSLTGRAMVGEVIIRGEPGRALRVDLPARIVLYGYTGGALTISRITSDLPALPRLDRDGRLRVRFGGELFISGDAEGNYHGDVPITVDYL